jgi:hypothetical protein
MLLHFDAAEANLLFGRGMLAGIDRREQKKQSAVVEADMMRKLREGAGITETAAMRLEAQERQDRADKYGAGDMRVRWMKGVGGVVGGSCEVKEWGRERYGKHGRHTNAAGQVAVGAESRQRGDPC